MKLVIFTAVFGKSDILRAPILPLPGIDKRCYTDMGFWGETAYQIIQAQLDDPPGRKCQRHVKIYWPEIFDNYQYSLYMDSNMQLMVDPVVFLDFLRLSSDILVFKHKSRNCLYDEAEECVDLGLVDSGVTAQQTSKYRSEGCPEKNGLYECTVIFRRHSGAMRKFSEAWWEEVKTFACRDQISFPYVAWKHKVIVSTFPESNIVRNPWFKLSAHAEGF